MPLFSVIIPTYNRADLIGQTLDSVLPQQDFPREEMEIIVVDDGSTDNTPEVLRGYQQQHGIRVIRQLNMGVGAARNAGVQSAGGEYIANLDGDDLWFPWTARTYRNAIETHGRPALLTGKQHEFRDPAELTGVTAAPMQVEAFADYYSASDAWRFYGTSSFVIRRDVAIATGGFSGGWGVADDADMGMKLGVAPGFVHFLAPATFAYRIHGGNIMNNMGRVYVGTSLLLDHEKGGHYPGGPARRRQRMQIITRHVRACCANCLRRGNNEMAWDMYWRTFGWHLRTGRLKFLAGFPAQVIAGKFRGRKQS